MGIKNTQIGAFRHGDCKYAQGKTTLEEAYDLSPQGIATVERRAESFAEHLSPTREVIMYSSPFGRALHTAKVAAKVFRNKKIPIRAMNIEPDLEELKNFSWEFFSPLINGGELSYKGETMIIDRNLTNPQGLSYQKYLILDINHQVLELLKGKVSDSYLSYLSTIESLSSVDQRINNFLRRAVNSNRGRRDIIAITHEAAISTIVDKFTRSESQALNRGNYVHLEARDNGIYVKSVGDFKEGNTSRNILE